MRAWSTAAASHDRSFLPRVTKRPVSWPLAAPRLSIMSAERTPDATPEILEVMSDLVRWRTYHLLHGLGPHRASKIAKLVSISQASMIKHLQVLEGIGFVTSEGDADRPALQLWRAVPGSLRLSGMEDSEESATNMHNWMRAFALAEHLLLREWVDEEQTWPLVWRRAALNYDYWLHLTSDELQELNNELHAVTEKWDKMSRARTGGDSAYTPVYVATNAIPKRRT